MPEDDAGDGQSLFEHLFSWLQRNSPDFLEELRRSFGARTAKEVLAYYLRTADDGVWLGAAYIAATGSPLTPVMVEHLRRWVEALIAGPDARGWFGRGPGAGAWRVAPSELRALLPPAHFGELETTYALRPVLRALYAGELDFGGERCRVRVFERSLAPPIGEALSQPPGGASGAAIPAPRPMTKDELQRSFAGWAASAADTSVPAGDAWSAAQGISRARGRKLRALCSEAGLHRRGRRPRK